MDAVKFTRAAMRMCNDYYSKCWSCPAGDDTSCKLNRSYSAISAEEKVAIVEQWAERHPAKTRQSEFLKLFPGVDVYETDGCLTLNPCIIYEKMRKECAGKLCSECRRAFWLAEVEE